MSFLYVSHTFLGSYYSSWCILDRVERSVSGEYDNYREGWMGVRLSAKLP